MSLLGLDKRTVKSWKAAPEEKKQRLKNVFDEHTIQSIEPLLTHSAPRTC